MEHDRDERHAIVNKHAEMLCKMAGEDADGLYEMMERLAQGNPRLNKTERGQLMGFINILIMSLGTYARQIEDSNTLWNSQTELIKNMEKAHELKDKAHDLLMELIRHREWDGLVEYERRFRK